MSKYVYRVNGKVIAHSASEITFNLDLFPSLGNAEVEIIEEKKKTKTKKSLDSVPKEESEQ